MRNKILRNSTLSVAFVLGACAGQSVDQTRGPSAAADPSDPIAKMEADVKLLTNQCQFDSASGGMFVQVASGETAILAMRLPDKAILVNGETCMVGTGSGWSAARAAPLAPAYATGTSGLLKSVSIVKAAGGASESVILDFTNGVFAPGDGTLTHGIAINLGADAGDTLVVKGTSGNDTVTAGLGGIAVNNSKKADITFASGFTSAGTGKLLFALGDGNDKFSASGDTLTGGTGGPWTFGLTVFGGNGNDTISEGAAATASEVVSGGAGVDTVDYGSRTAALAVTVGTGYTNGVPAVTNPDGTNPTVLTLTGVARAPVSLRVEVTSVGTIVSGTAVIRYSIDGGLTWTSNVTVPTTGLVAVGSTGLTLNFSNAAGLTVQATTFWTSAFTTSALLAQYNDGEAAEFDDIAADVEVVLGGSGNDTLAGYKDNFSTNLGNATLAGAAYTLNGGAGDDYFLEVNVAGTKVANASEVMIGGAGVDTVDYYDRTIALAVTMDGTKADDGESGEKDNIGADVENIKGSTVSDVITGNAASNTITGMAGNDTLSGLDGDDVFPMGALTDGADVISGGNGIDTVDYSARSLAGKFITAALDGVTPSGEAPTAGAAAAEGDILGTDVEKLFGSRANVLILNKLTGNAANNELWGGNGLDTLDGAGGDDVIDTGNSGGAAIDVITCGAGFDVVVNKGSAVNVAADCEVF